MEYGKVASSEHSWKLDRSRPKRVGQGKGDRDVKYRVEAKNEGISREKSGESRVCSERCRSGSHNRVEVRAGEKHQGTAR